MDFRPKFPLPEWYRDSSEEELSASESQAIGAPKSLERSTSSLEEGTLMLGLDQTKQTLLQGHEHYLEKNKHPKHTSTQGSMHELAEASTQQKDHKGFRCWNYQKRDIDQIFF